MVITQAVFSLLRTTTQARNYYAPGINHPILELFPVHVLDTKWNPPTTCTGKGSNVSSLIFMSRSSRGTVGRNHGHVNIRSQRAVRGAMNSHTDTDLSSDESHQEQQPLPAPSCTKGKIRFSKAQKACLNAFYMNGMTGVGTKHADLIAKAASDTQLSIDQVKVQKAEIDCSCFSY